VRTWATEKRRFSAIPAAPASSPIGDLVELAGSGDPRRNSGQPRSPAEATPVGRSATAYPRPILFGALIDPPAMPHHFAHSEIRRKISGLRSAR
jgi:hypothetical protein